MDTTTLWNKTLPIIQKEISPANFATWFKDIKPEYHDASTLYISVPNEFIKDWFISKYNKVITKAVREIDTSIRSIEYVVGGKGIERKQSIPITMRPQELPISNLYVNKDDNLNPRYTFESFIIGPFNELAFSAAQAVIKNPGVYNPLYIFGSTGLGKTHLIQAIGNTLKKNNPKLRVYYVSSERFTNDYIDSIQKNTTYAFKERYRSYDVIIMDDIQFFSGKEKTQEEVFHLFNTLHDKNKQIIFSSDKHPNLIVGLEERLKSRLGAGMVVDVNEPELESKMAIIRAKQNQLQITIDDDAVEYIARYCDGSIRELEGVLQTLMNQSMIRGKQISLTDTKQILKHTTKTKKQTSTEDIVKIVADYFNLNPDTIYETTRRKEIVHARQIIMFLLREDFNISFPLIGKKLGDRDHTTVIHSYEKVKQEIEQHNHTEQEVETIRSILKTA